MGGRGFFFRGPFWELAAGWGARRQAKPLMFAESRGRGWGERGRRAGEGRRRQPGREAAAEEPWTARSRLG